MLAKRCQQYGVFPQDLDTVEFWAVGRKIVQAQPLLCPLAPLFVHDITFVDRSIIGHDDARLDRDLKRLAAGVSKPRIGVRRAKGLEQK
jgi:hypothetical protein